MKRIIILSSFIIMGLFFTSASAQQPPVPKNLALSHPGIQWDWNMKAGNYTFDVVTVSNYDMQNVTLSGSNKTLIFTGNSTHTGNIAEITIPSHLIGGNLTVIQDGKSISPRIAIGKDSSTIILEFNQTGKSMTAVVGTTYLPEFAGLVTLVMAVSFGIVCLTLGIRKF